MGTWGSAPWDDDAAADWYGDTLRRIGLPRAIEAALRLDVAEHFQEVRAAAALVVLLGRVYVYPHDQLDPHLALAIAKLREIRKLDVCEESPEIASAVDNEIAALTARLENQGGPGARKPAKEWWLTWL